MTTNTTERLVKHGSAYCARLDVGEVWVKRISGTWQVIYRFINPQREWQWAILGRHATKRAALDDALRLIG